jgi:aspartate ammonia-lyase
MLDMVCFHALGCDTAILHSAQAGQLELNVMMPVVAYNLLLEIEILSGGMRSFTQKCVSGIVADTERCRQYAESSSALVTALVPHIGYAKAAEIAKESLATGKSIKHIAASRKIMDPGQLEELLDIHKLTVDPGEKERNQKGKEQ